jgi:hypothetical protein
MSDEAILTIEELPEAAVIEVPVDEIFAIEIADYIAGEYKAELAVDVDTLQNITIGVASEPGPKGDAGKFGGEFSVTLSAALIQQYLDGQGLLAVPILETLPADCTVIGFIDGFEQPQGTGWDLSGSLDHLLIYLPDSEQEKNLFISEQLVYRILWA